MKKPAVWDDEELFYSGDEYFAELLLAISRAQSSLHMESYIFEKGVLGDRMVGQLIEAAKRGIKVRLIVDGCLYKTFVHD